MDPAAQRWTNWWMGSRERKTRARRPRRHGRPTLRRSVFRLLSNFAIGVFLVGCASSPFASQSMAKTDPIGVLRESQVGNERLTAYRTLSDPARFSGEDRSYAVMMLVSGLEQETSELARSAAAASLASYNEPEAVQALKDATADPSAMVRADACRSLGKQQDPTAADLLGRLAKTDKNVDVRIAATTAMAGIGHEACNSHLLECLRDDSIVVAEAARSGLRTNLSTDYGTNYDAWAAYMQDPASAPADAIRVVDHRDNILEKFFR